MARSTKPGIQVQNQLETMTIDSKSIDLSNVKLPIGRPSDPNSARQKQLAEKAAYEAEMKAKHGADWKAKQGRPSDPNSANYKKKQELEARKSDPNYVPKKGRPVVEGSARQIKLAKLNERKLAYVKAQQEENK